MLIQTLRYLKCVSQQKVSQLSTSFIWQWHLIRTTLICRFTYLRSGLHGLFVFGENRNKRWKKQACLTLSCAARAEPFPLQHDGEKFVLDGCQDGETRWSEWFSLSHVSVNTFVRLWCFTAAIFIRLSVFKRWRCRVWSVFNNLFSYQQTYFSIKYRPPRLAEVMFKVIIPGLTYTLFGHTWTICQILTHLRSTSVHRTGVRGAEVHFKRLISACVVINVAL